MMRLGQVIPSSEQQTPQALAAYHKSEIEKWWPIIKAANIKVGVRHGGRRGLSPVGTGGWSGRNGQRLNEERRPPEGSCTGTLNSR